MKCNDTEAEIQWSTCRGAEKFSIELLSAQKESLDYKESPGTCHKCKFEIDPSRKIRLGDIYKIKVIAYKGEWENSGVEDCFFGENFSGWQILEMLGLLSSV